MKTKIFTIVHQDGSNTVKFSGTLDEIDSYVKSCKLDVDDPDVLAFSGEPVTLRRPLTVEPPVRGMVADTTIGPEGGSVTKIRRGRGRPKKNAVTRPAELSITNGHVKDSDDGANA